MKQLLFLFSLVIFSHNALAFNYFKTPPQKSYVSFPVQQLSGEVIQTSGLLKVPVTEETSIPAVIVLHSSFGVDTTGDFYAKRLNAAGIATLEIDLWDGRGLTGALDRPASPHETLPDMYAALKLLAENPKIDADKIGVIGFSWGAVMSMLAATNQFDATINSTEYSIAAHVAHYPICYVYNVLPGFEFTNLTGSPVLIQAAEFDEYEYPGACDAMASQLPEADKALVEVVEYPGVYHTWDRLEPEVIVEDPFAHLGQGGLVKMSPDLRTALKSRRKAVSFFIEAFSD